jgi:ATP-dependent Clp protease ATP-binding subunit ClpC
MMANNDYIQALNGQFHLKLKYDMRDKIFIFWGKTKKIVSIAGLLLIAGIGLGIIFNRMMNAQGLISFYHSFWIRTESNLWFFGLLFLSFYFVYFYQRAEQVSLVKNDLRLKFTNELRKIYDQAAFSSAGAIPRNILLALVRDQKGKLAWKMELPIDSFIIKLQSFNFPESYLQTQVLFSAVLESVKENKITVFDFILGLIRTHEKYKDLFFEHNIDEQEFVYYLSLMAEAEQIVSQKRQLFKATAIRQNTPMNKALTAKKNYLLEQVGVDMTLQAKNHQYPYVLGRDKEMKDLIRILKIPNRGVLLLGKAGVGKSAIAEGLACLMAAEKVPKELQDKRLILINIGLLASMERGKNRERGGIVELLEEVKATRNVILVFDDLANLIGTEKQSEGGALDAFAILSSYIVNYNLKVIGSVTPKDYSQYIQTSSSSSSRYLEIIDVVELDKIDILRILSQQAMDLEKQLGITISILALKNVYEFAKRYFQHAVFPAKGLNLLKESAYYAWEKKQGVLTSEMVAELVSQKTNIQLTTINEVESQKLLSLENRIHQKLIGQSDPVRNVAAALRRARLNLHDQTKTIANFLFLGPTGVGKTELAKSLAEVYFGNQKNMVRIDMSEFQEKKAISKLIGDKTSKIAGYLTDAVRRNPFSLVLLDEIEKAHPDILNLFLQVMDDGRLTDSNHDTVDFTNIILIATSNVGSFEIQKFYQEGLSPTQILEKMMRGILSQYFRPEFLNRFDDIAVFHPLENKHIEQITHLLMTELKHKLFEQRIFLEWDREFINQFARKHFSSELGARPIRRAIQDEIGSLVAEKILSGKLKKNQRVRLQGERIKIA